MHPENARAAARLTALYEAHSADVFRYAIHLTGRREDAEDVVQFVFLRAYGMLESGTELVNPRAWLIKTTKHRSLNMIRDRREAPTADTDLPLAPRFDPDPAEAEALADVRSTLWALPESQHHAFVLRHWSGLSQDEIADVLATTPSAVESLLVRARTTLLQEQQAGTTECVDVRRRLVQALVPTAGHAAHIANCGRCRTAQTRLLRASEFAASFALVPRPYVAHTLAAAIPGFGTSTVAAGTTATGAAGGGAAGGAGGGAGGGMGVATASAATKVTVLAKVALAATTAAVALGAAHPVRSAVTSVLLGHPSAHAATRQPARTGPGSGAGLSGATPPGASPGSGAGRSGSGGAGSANNPGGGHGKGAGGQGSGKGNGNGTGKGKTNGTGKPAGTGQGKPAGAGGKGKAKGKPTTAGASGKTHGKPATAGGNGKGKAKGSAGGTSTKGKGKATGTSTGTASKGKGKATGTSTGSGTGSSSGTTGQGQGKGKGKA